MHRLWIYLGWTVLALKENGKNIFFATIQDCQILIQGAKPKHQKCTFDFKLWILLVSIYLYNDKHLYLKGVCSLFCLYYYCHRYDYDVCRCKCAQAYTAWTRSWRVTLWNWFSPPPQVPHTELTSSGSYQSSSLVGHLCFVFETGSHAAQTSLPHLILLLRPLCHARQWCVSYIFCLTVDMKTVFII